MFADGIRDRFPHFIGGDAVVEEPIDLLLQGFFDLRFILRRESYIRIDAPPLEKKPVSVPNVVASSRFFRIASKDPPARPGNKICSKNRPMRSFAERENAR